MTIFQTTSVLAWIKRLPRTKLCRAAILAIAAVGGAAAWAALATGHAGWLLPVAAGLFVLAGVFILAETGR